MKALCHPEADSRLSGGAGPRFLAASRSLLIAALLACGVTSAAGRLAAVPDKPAPPKLRLPDYAAPERYHLNLTAVPDTDTFSGTVDIDLTVRKPTPVLWLNATDITIKDMRLETGGHSLSAKVITTPKDYVGFAFGETVNPGTAKLHIAYEGKISRKEMEGVFQVKDGDTWYVYTQFEATTGRKAVPCFDEPGYKVPWQVTLKVRKGDGAFSNTPLLSETDAGNGMKTVTFAETKSLPSYLVAFAVGPFDVVDAGKAGKKDTQVRIIVPRGHNGEARYAAESTPAIVNLLENYFGIPYPYEKLDEVSIPLAGYAMEHPGLVTYGSQIIVWKPDQNSLENRRVWASIAAHELAHQWFGDLVTMAWWDDIWLNEGFASWMADKIVNQYQPEWNMHITELNNYQEAMEADGLISSRRVREPIESDDDIANASVDVGITYNKGSALLNMFEMYMGPERFQKGIRRYLDKHAWGNATSADFLAALGAEDSSIPAAFSSFLDQAGVPEVSAELKCDGGAPRLALSQQRFLPVGSKGSVDQSWQIPVCAKYPAGGAEARECTLMTAKTKELALPKATSCPGWVFANEGENGYYRVRYKGGLLDALLQNDSQTLTLPERVGLVGDLAALSESGQIARGAALAMVPQLVRDPAPQVISKTTEIAAGLEDNIIPPELLPRYRRFLAEIYGPLAHELGWKSKPGEDSATRLLRPQLLGVVANEAEDPELIAEAKTMVDRWLSERSAIDPDILGTVLRTAARHGDQALFNRLRAQAKQEQDEDVRAELLRAMGSFRDPEVVKIAMPIALGGEFDSRESLTLVFGAARWPPNRDLAFNFVKQNFDALVGKLPANTGAILPFAAANYCDGGHATEVETFFKGRSTKYEGGPRNLAQVVEGINLCAATRSSEQESVEAFLKGSRIARRPLASRPAPGRRLDRVASVRAGRLKIAGRQAKMTKGQNAKRG